MYASDINTVSGVDSSLLLATAAAAVPRRRRWRRMRNTVVWHGHTDRYLHFSCCMFIAHYLHCIYTSHRYRLSHRCSYYSPHPLRPGDRRLARSDNDREGDTVPGIPHDIVHNSGQQAGTGE